MAEQCSLRGQCLNGPFQLSVYLSSAVVSKKVDEAKWDETLLEAYLHTLRVRKQQPG